MKISPTSFMMWQKDKMEFWLKYMSGKRYSLPQTEPMAAGSGFDAFIKARILDVPVADILKQQVEPQNMTFAVEAGMILENFYIENNGLSNMLGYIEKPDVVSDVSAIVEGVSLRGKPDAWGKSEFGLAVLDWKVNGYMSSSSPAPGYVWASHKDKAHKDVTVEVLGALPYSAGCLSKSKLDWATQCAIYAWCLGAEPGSKVFALIDQITRSAKGELVLSLYRSYISSEFQLEILHQLQVMTKDLTMPSPAYAEKYGLDYETMLANAGTASTPWLRGL